MAYFIWRCPHGQGSFAPFVMMVWLLICYKGLLIGSANMHSRLASNPHRRSHHEREGGLKGGNARLGSHKDFPPVRQTCVKSVCPGDIPKNSIIHANLTFRRHIQVHNSPPGSRLYVFDHNISEEGIPFVVRVTLIDVGWV